MATLLPAATGRRPVGVVVVLGVAVAGCWAYLIAVSAAMGTPGSALAMPMTAAWTPGDLVLMWVMWAVMMAAMMVPSATPMLSAYATTVRSPTRRVSGSVPAFVLGYLVVWTGFALAATLLQWRLHAAALVDPTGTATTPWLAGGVLVLAGGYQFTDLKHAMLSRCRSPIGFLLHDWRDGTVGGAVMGLHHGVLCLGCCWALMGLLLVLGVMNLWWIALLATVVLVEKVTRNDLLPRLLGAVMVAGGVLLLVGAAA